MSPSRRIAPWPCAPLVSPSPVPVVRSRCRRTRCPHRAAASPGSRRRAIARGGSPPHAESFACRGLPAGAPRPRPRCAPRCAMRPPLNVARPAFRADRASPSWNTRPTAHTTENACYHRTIENASICDTSTATDAANGKSSLRTRPEWHR